MELTITQKKVSIHINKLIFTKVIEQLKKLAPKKVVSKIRITERLIEANINDKHIMFGIRINFAEEIINFVCGSIHLTDPTIFKNVANALIYCSQYRNELGSVLNFCNACPAKYFKGKY